ncbi:20S proteasome subunit A/B [Halobacterium wangiae]|uniref:20S proteasome subunit A/B n=1 Tax=Halobacterium wangiae TaxID=2902623 RepID=UPI001E578D8C|nr:20S proteasome subunit A/B [Halobacterium wangiae]
MGTVVAVETEDGVVIAADTLAVEDGDVTSKRVRRLFEFDAAVAGAVGDQGDVDEFGRRIEAELRQLDVEAGREVGITNLGQIAADVAEGLGVAAVVAAHDGEGRAKFQRIGEDGSTVSAAKAALGTGSSVALGRLEHADVGPELVDAAELARETVRAAQDRDPETGGDVDVVELPSSESTSTGTQ